VLVDPVLEPAAANGDEPPDEGRIGRVESLRDRQPARARARERVAAEGEGRSSDGRDA
jgi:hypothetical protein